MTDMYDVRDIFNAGIPGSDLFDGILNALSAAGEDGADLGVGEVDVLRVDPHECLAHVGESWTELGLEVDIDSASKERGKREK